MLSVILNVLNFQKNSTKKLLLDHSVHIWVRPSVPIFSLNQTNNGNGTFVGLSPFASCSLIHLGCARVCGGSYHVKILWDFENSIGKFVDIKNKNGQVRQFK